MPARFTCLILLGLTAATAAQDRDTKVRTDRERFQGSSDWIYNDLDAARRAARRSGKPLLVVFRCIPCEACQEFDDDVARRDPIIRDRLDQFICARIPQANAIDLARFQHDFDLSFAVHFLNADGTVYGRFGTRSGRPEYEDISLEGLRRAMDLALGLHAGYPANRESLAGKQPRPTRYQTPRDYPALAGKYADRIDYEGQTARSCIHCHQIREAEWRVYRAANAPIPDEVLFPDPDPATIGLKLDPREAATVQRVEPGSPADRAGMKAGDAIDRIAGQPILSIADVQWALHGMPEAGRLALVLRRDGSERAVALELPAGWRRGDISWRATTWDLRRMALGGMRLEALSEADRRAAGLSADGMALRVEHVGEYDDHAVALRAGVRKGDVLVGFDGQTGRMSESDLLAHALRHRKPGDIVEATFLRDGRRKSFRLVQQ